MPTDPARTAFTATVGGAVEEGPSESTPRSDSFDIEPPYVPDLDDLADRFLDRELSWLRFNTRVLELAEDPNQPLLERVRFLAIFASNLDEFFMVRVAGLKRRIAAGVAVRAASGLLPREVLEQIWSTTDELMHRKAALFRDDLVPALAKEDIELLRWPELSREEQKQMKKLFKERLFPVLTPLAVDPAHPFPYISGLLLNLAVLVRNPQTQKEHFARVKVPPIFSRFVPLGGQRFVPLEDVIAEHLKSLFPGMTVVAVHTFRVTRNEDLEVEEDDAENLLAALEKELLRRRFGPPVRLEVEESIDDHVLELLVSELDVSEAEVFRLPARSTCAASTGSRTSTGPTSSSRPSSPRRTPRWPRSSRRPRWTSSARSSAATTPAPPLRLVLHLGAAVHRAGRGRPARARDQADAVPHLRRLADHRRPDRRRRVGQAGAGARGDQGPLRRAGQHPLGAQARARRVSRGLRTGRAQDALQARDGGARRAQGILTTHIGTGNYNPKTARLYEDFGLLTSNADIGEDVANLFNNLSGFSRHTGTSGCSSPPTPSGTSSVAPDPQRGHAHHRDARPRGSGSRPTPSSTSGPSTSCTAPPRRACR